FVTVIDNDVLSACEEEVPSPQPDGICLTCGEDLISPPNNANNSQSQRRTAAPRQDDDAAATAAMALMASSMENATAIDPSSLLPFVNQLRGNPNEEGGVGSDNVDDLAGILPPEALNPQAGTAKTRPVSQTALDNLKRIVLTPQSAELFDAQISLYETRPIGDFSPCISKSAGCLTLNAVPGEFGPIASPPSSGNKGLTTGSTPRTAGIIVFSPRTTKGNISSETLSEIAFLRQHRMPFVAYVERGDGITFVQKAILCQRAGWEKGKESLCIGVIVGNTASGGGKEVWPYVMQDTKKEAQTLGLKIPVVMIRREDGLRLVQWTKKEQMDNSQYTPCQISIHSKQANSHTCPVCTDSYVPGATIIRLPLCGHVFHESCALAWLSKHNTCPYCRKEMPTDDEDYEQERRRREANPGGVESGSSDANGHSFYG
ncbi:hypothetical protein ACHAXR_010115, partial [Thalassiosira sp. AJA248-18]